MSYIASEPRSQVTAPQALDLPLWFREENGEYPANADEIAALLNEARTMVDRELMEAIYVMLRVRP